MLLTLTDEQWFAAIAVSAGPENGTTLFPLPDEKTQTGTVGRSGEPILRDAFMFWQFCRQMLIAHGNGLGRGTKVLDFGCAWARILRFWLRDLPADNLHGVDVEEQFLSLAREHVKGPHYVLINHAPPLPHADNSLDLIYAYSVFSHLPGNLADAWIAEFARVLKPGGIACLTTRPRAHIEHAGTDADKTAHATGYSEAIADRASALAAYNAGQLVYYPSGGGGGLAPDTYGEAIIPADYARENWTALEFIDFAENYSATYLQPCFVLRKPL